MSDFTPGIWRCPSCGSRLDLEGRSFCCKNNHQYDLAKQGYVNLLLANQKNSREPGDDAQMIEARSRFLIAGYYDFLSASLCSLVDEYRDSVVSSDVPLNLLDVGCGEGFYSRKIASHFNKKAENLVCCYGSDISKAAVKRASSCFSRELGLSGAGRFTVASNYQLPVVDGGVDIVLSVFSPISADEIKRVLSPKGILIRVLPAPRHLFQIKSLIYPEVKLHDVPEVCRGFSLTDQIQINRTVMLEGTGGLSDLLAMTPLNWRGNYDEKLRAQSLDCFEVEFDFFIQSMCVE